MGHYAAEMGSCPDCRRYLCTCPNKPVLAQPMQWVIGKDWSVSKKRLTPFDLYVYKTKGYATRQDAEAAVPALILEKIEEHHAEIAMLEMILRMEPGKTNICPKCYKSFTECFCNGGYR